MSDADDLADEKSRIRSHFDMMMQAHGGANGFYADAQKLYNFSDQYTQFQPKPMDWVRLWVEVYQALLEKYAAAIFDKRLDAAIMLHGHMGEIIDKMGRSIALARRVAARAKEK